MPSVDGADARNGLDWSVGICTVGQASTLAEQSIEPIGRSRHVADMPRSVCHLQTKGLKVSEYSFEGRVAVVTGAGRGIGRAHARLLAERGASVVVNDLGSSMEGNGSDVGPAQAAVDEIVAAGGTAVPETSDVSTPAGGQAIIDTALKEFGRVDIVVNNAGTVRWGGPPDVGADNIEHHLAVHTMGSFHTIRAAWPHMAAQGYGRIVNTTSVGMFGLPDNLGYATAKAAVVGMTRSLKVAGADHGITINLIAPNAMTRMGGAPDDGTPTSIESLEARPTADHMGPDLVSPIVAFLAHESCPVSGEIYVAGAGRFSRLFIASTHGYVHPDGQPTIEAVAENWATINDETGYYVPTDLFNWAASYMEHLSPSEPTTTAS